MSPYEALYGRLCRTPVCWTEVGESSTTSLKLIRVTSEKVDLIRKVFSRLRAGGRVTSTDDDDF